MLSYICTFYLYVSVFALFLVGCWSLVNISIKKSFFFRNLLGLIYVIYGGHGDHGDHCFLGGVACHVVMTVHNIS